MRIKDRRYRKEDTGGRIQEVGYRKEGTGGRIQEGVLGRKEVRSIE